MDDPTTTDRPNPELALLCTYTTSELVPQMLRQVTTTRAAAMARHDEVAGHPEGTTARILTELDARLSTAIGTDALDAVEEATTTLRRLMSELHNAVTLDERVAGELDTPDEDLYVAVRDVYGTVWRAHDAQRAALFPELVHDESFWSGQDDHQLDAELRHLSWVAATRLLAGTFWGMRAQLVAEGVSPRDAADTVTAAQRLNEPAG